MNTQLQVLIALQDILLLIRDAKDPSRKKQYGRIGFKMSNLKDTASLFCLVNKFISLFDCFS